MKNIYLDNTQIHDYLNNIGFIVFPNIQGLDTPSIRLPSFNRPNVDGAFVPNQLYGGRLITLAGKVFADDASTYRARRRELETACKIKRVDDDLNPITMKFKTMDDLLLQVEVYTKKLVFNDKYLTHGDFKIDLFAPSIYLESQELHNQNIFIFSGGGMDVPTGVPMDMSAEGDTEAILNNVGNIDAYPQLSFHGPMQDPTLTNETNGDALSIVYTMSSSNERIEIDTVNRTALYFSTPTATGTNFRQYISGDFLSLQSGNNSIKLTSANYNNEGYISISWRDAFSGV